jgi:HD-like signal output (HDOD) protein
LGGAIAERWNFPPGIIAGIRFHHNPFWCAEFADLVSLVHLCDIVAMLTGIGGGADGLSYRASKEIMKRFGLREKDLEGVITDLASGMKKVERLLNPQ